MRRFIHIIAIILLTVIAAESCDFLKEDPKTFITEDEFYSDATSIASKVNGMYAGLSQVYLSSLIGIAVNTEIFFELITGYSDRTRVTNTHDFGMEMPLFDSNAYIGGIWQNCYKAIMDINDGIQGIERTEGVLTDEQKNRYLGEAYTLRAFYSFILVRLFGPVPYTREVTTDFKNFSIPKVPVSDIYDYIVQDLTTAETLMKDLEWTNTSGHVTKGTVKSILAEVYLTMAGYPLRKTECYALAYDKAKEVVESGAYSLFASYADLRNEANENSGEFILSIQREANNAGYLRHFYMLPYPEINKEDDYISVNEECGGAILPTIEFYNSYDNADLRKAEQGFFYTSYDNLAGKTMKFSRPHIYKFWDESAKKSGKSGADYYLIRYAQVLLTMAEAKAMADGGTTTDADAIDAYYQVRHRALPGEGKPASISFERVFKERVWELCYECVGWFDMIRTRKTYNPAANEVINMAGFQPAGHLTPFSSNDVLFPYPQREALLNPLLVRTAADYQ